MEAKQLWQLEEGTESIPSVAASALMHAIFSCQGKDKVGLSYLTQGLRKARDYGLFRKKTAPQVYDEGRPELRRGLAVAAWGLYSYIV